MILTRILASLSLVATCAAQGLEVRLYQYDWPLSDGSVVTHSRAGGFELLFDDEDTQLLASEGGGFVNIALLDNYTGQPHWLVRNLPLSFSSFDDMYDRSVVVPFGMGDVNGLPWGQSWLSTSVSATPAATMPIDYIQSVFAERVVHPYLIGGWVLEDGDTAAPGPGTDPNQVALDSQGVTQGPQDPEAKIVLSAQILPTVGGFGAPDAGGMNCGPASVAGSIAYMAALNNHPVPPVQDIFEGLQDCMGTDEDGTTTAGLLDGKNAYTSQNELPICSEVLQGVQWFEFAMDVLKRGGDVEVMYRRGDCSKPGASGHIAMIHSMALFDDGSMMIMTLEPKTNEDGTTSWDEVPLFFDPGGKLGYDAGTGASDGCLWGFFAELWQSNCGLLR